MSKSLKKPAIVTILAYADDLKHHDKTKRIFGLLTAFQQTIAIWLSDKVHVESFYDRDKLHWCKKEVVVIPPGVDDRILNMKSSMKELQTIASKINAKDEERIVLYLGRIHKAKGVDHAISAIVMLKKENKKVKLVLAGPDNSFLHKIRKDVQALGLSDAFVYVGKVTDEEKMALLDLADVVVLPSRSDVVEAYSIVASEAWARGKPVVAYSVGALKYRIKNGVNGYLVRANDKKELAAKIVASFSLSEDFPRPPDILGWVEVAKHFKQIYANVLYE
jgi:glycosyltransferase involved in cell wall biosynthesis